MMRIQMLCISENEGVRERLDESAVANWCGAPFGGKPNCKKADISRVRQTPCATRGAMGHA